MNRPAIVLDRWRGTDTGLRRSFTQWPGRQGGIGVKLTEQ
jgi:hypothetical protein